MPHVSNKAAVGGPMTECTVAQKKDFKSCHFFEEKSNNALKCRYCAFDEYCINIKAYLDVKGVEISVIDTVN